jgi:hypothetical protein
MRGNNHMKVTIDRKPRDESEGVCLTVYANSEKEENHHHQFKIDVWSIKNSGLSYLRLDGFGCVSLWEDVALAPLLTNLANLNSQKVLKIAKKWRETMRRSVADFQERTKGTVAVPDEVSDLDVVEFFEAARAVVLKELGPLRRTLPTPEFAHPPRRNGGGRVGS